jgi:hypothetical protein
MHTRVVDFGTVLKDRFRPPDQPIDIKESTQGAIVKPGREGPTVPVQLHGGLRSPNRTVTPVGTIIIHMARGATCIDNIFDTSSTVLSRLFRPIKVVNLRGIK